jgi:anthranilate synthase component 2
LYYYRKIEVLKILIIDNYDSFTFNLYHIIEQYASTVEVTRPDQLKSGQTKKYDKIVISPGPGLPVDFPGMIQTIVKFKEEKPILGICLGFQALVEHFGGKLTNLDAPLHGISKKVTQTTPDEPFYKNIPKTFETGRYHSWAIKETDVPKCFRITSKDDSGYAMSVSHKILNLNGVQFHPESVLTPYGKKILENWIKLC